MLKILPYILIIALITTSLSGCSNSILPHQSTPEPGISDPPSINTQVGPTVIVPNGGGLGFGFGVSGI